MDKSQLIALIEEQLVAGTITKADLLKIAPVKEEGSKNLTRIFYIIGAIIAIVGVIILIAQNWVDIGFGGRILVSLGLSFVTYVIGLLMRNPEHRVLSQVMFMISAVLAPLGAAVFIDQANLDFTWGYQAMTALIMLIVYSLALVVSKKNVLILVVIASASWAYYAFILNVFGDNFYDTDILQWATMILGGAYLLLATGFRSIFPVTDTQDEREKNGVRNTLHALGTLAVLGGGIAVGGIFDLIFIAFIFAAFYGSVYLKSRAMLTLGAAFLMAHIIKLTSKYFVDSIGWPVMLIVCGFLVIGIGYMTFYLNKKFISVKA